MTEQVWTAEEVAEVSAEALRLAEELRPIWPDLPAHRRTCAADADTRPEEEK